MIPILSHIEENKGFNSWVTTDNRQGFTVELETIDLEMIELSKVMHLFKGWAQRLDPRILARFNISSHRSFEGTGCQRSNAFEALGRKVSKCSLTLETAGEFVLLKRIKEEFLKKRSHSPSFKILQNAFESLKDSGFTYRPLSLNETEQLFFSDAKNWVVLDSFISTGRDYRGVIRLNKPASTEIHKSSFAKLKCNISLPFEISMSFSRMGKAETQVMLKKKVKQSDSSGDRIGDLTTQATESALEKTLLEGDSLFNTEILLSFTRSDVFELKSDLKAGESVLSDLGEPIIETFGALPSYASTLPGSPQHVSFLEVGENLGYYFPTFEFGSSKKLHSLKPIPSTLSVHRANESLGEISILGGEHLNSNGVIVGASGRGKSGLVGSLSSALLNDPNVSMIKVDVGGSHSKECRLFNGTEYVLNLSRSSGINPFEVISNGEVEESTRAVLCNFLSVLVLEDRESALPKRVKLELDDALKLYISKKPKNPSLNAFYKNSKTLPRRELLSRWTEKGMYGHAFSKTEPSHSELNERLRYYNFSEIFQASDPEFAQAGMAAVLAQFNIEMKLYPNRRLVLICDETPFFIEKCFEFFKFSTANVRKFGASVILVVQFSEHLIVNGDRGIIENSFHRFLMSSDGDSSEFRSRFNLSSHQFDSLKSLRSIPKKYSEFLYQFGDQAFKCRLRLTPEEYWKITTTQSDKQKIEKLMSAVPELGLKEALQCLSLIG